jgi:hypothetical protein
MVPDILQDIAFYVGFVRDLLVLAILLVILIFVFSIYRKVSQALNSAGRILDNTEEIVNTVSENIVRPASSGSGVAFSLGKVIAFLRGARKKRKEE